jgi:predicted DNA-binding transcriptional regulator AlpA
MGDALTTKDVLKLCGNIARGTLYRWMKPEIAEQMGIEAFPAGSHTNPRSRRWDRHEVQAWVVRNRGKLPRQPHLTPDERFEVDRSQAVELTLGQAYDAASRVAEEDDTGFDYGDFEERYIYPMTEALLQALSSRGAKGAVWMGDKFAFVFPEGDEGDRQAVAFKLAFG